MKNNKTLFFEKKKKKVFFQTRYAKGNTANAKDKTEDLNQSSATENAIGNAGGNLTSCHMLRCSALT